MAARRSIGNFVQLSASLSMRSKQVLAVEDNQINQKLISRILGPLGVKLTIAGDGLEALALLTSTIQFDLILMDTHMPRMDGFEATKHIRALAPITPSVSNTTASNIDIKNNNGGTNGRTIPIIGLGAFSDDKSRCFEVGMNAFLPKPLEARRFREIVSAYLATPSHVSQPLPLASKGTMACNAQS
jgi:CheY-like chemotaxis protein